MSPYANCIGGYGEFELPYLNEGIHSEAVAVQSARAALFLFLQSVDAEIIHIPEYICDSILPPINELKIDVKYYPIDKQLNPIGDYFLDNKEFILLVNYFGLCNTTINSFIKRSNIKPESIIVDNSQALFANPINCAATIYSPRKFLGIPDGGFLYTSEKIDIPNNYFPGEKYCHHLLLRSTNVVNQGYESFLKVEYELNDFSPHRMSLISERLIKSYNLNVLKETRVRNFKKLHQEFGYINCLNIELGEGEVPLCYPLMLNRSVSDICKHLIEFSIFLPRYWPKLDNAPSSDEHYDNTLFLPVDHRLDRNKIDYLISKIKEQLTDE